MLVDDGVLLAGLKATWLAREGEGCVIYLSYLVRVQIYETWIRVEEKEQVRGISFAGGLLRRLLEKGLLAHSMNISVLIRLYGHSRYV